MQHELREIFARHADDAEVLDQQRIGPRLLEHRERFGHFGQLGLFDERIQRKVDLPAEPVGVRDDLAHAFRREIFAALAGVEFGQSGVNRIRPRLKRRQRAGGTARRRQQFGIRPNAGIGCYLHSSGIFPFF